jgi:hypothetical protein
MTLTAKQEKFAQCIADGMNQSDAYRSAYDASKMKAETIQSKACLLMADGKVRARADELKSALAAKALWTREQSVSVLVNVIDDGDSKGGDKISAVKVLNEMHGFNAPIGINLTGRVETIDASKLSTEVLTEILAAKDAANKG